MSSEEDQEIATSIAGIRDELNRLEQRFATFNHQQFSFINALDHCRQIAFEPSREITSISQVIHYAEHVSDSATGKRIMRMFINLVKDLTEFRRKLVKLTNQRDERLEKIFATWKKTLEPTQNISQLRVKFPHSQLNHLSVTESRFHFGGIISVLPTAMDCTRDAVNRIEATRAYRRPASRGRIGSSNSFFGNSPFAPGNYTMPRKKASPIISSPVPSHSINHGTVPSVSTRVSSAKNYSNQKFKPMRSRSANPAYKRQVMSQHPAVATQTPKFLGSTVKPNLDWNHHALSEEEIRKTLKDRPRTGQARPNWKP